MQNSFQVGYLIDSRNDKRINQFMSSVTSPFTIRSEVDFQANPYPRSFLNLDEGLETQTDSVSEQSNTSLGVIVDDVSMKQPWLDYFCP
jgi:hypothetical protein